MKAKINERLRELRKEKGVSIRVVAEYLHVTTTTCTRYELGSRTPSIDTIIALCLYYQVSADYILGLVDY